MNKIIPVILVILLLIEGGILSANIPKSQHIQKVLLGPKKIFLDSFAERLSEDIRNDDTFESYKSTIASRVTVDNNGNLTHFNHDYVYNWKNQLVRVTTGTGVNVEYKYDALGRRIVKKVKAPNSSDTVTRYVHDGYQVIEERNGSDQVTYRYTYGNGIDERIEIEKHVKNQDGTYEWKIYLPLHDSIGNVTALTNDKGHLIERYNYSPYGEVTYFNTESAPGIDYVRIKDGVIRIKFDRPVDPGKIYIHLYIKSTQQVISGNKEYIDIEEIGYRTSTLPTDEMLTLNLKNQSGPGEPIDIFSQDFIYQGQADVIVHDGGKPYVKKEVQVENNIVIIFNEEIDPDTTTYEVELEKNNIKIDGTLVRTGANEYKFFPSGGLVKDAQYMLRMSGFKDLSGNAMDDLEHSFVSTYNNTLIFEASILTANNHSVVGNTSLMHGRDYEPEVGLYYFRNRYYHPVLGRFLQQDPMGYEDSLNTYQAFGMNPVNFTDPFGELTYSEFLDIKATDMILKGYSPDEILEFINRGTFKRGYLAKVDLWNEYYIEDSFTPYEDPEYNPWGRQVYLWIQDKASVAKDFWASQDSVLTHTIGATLTDFGGGSGRVFNLGTRSGETIIDYQRSKDFETFLIMGSTLWGESGEAFLMTVGGYSLYKNLRNKWSLTKVKGGVGKFKNQPGYMQDPISGRWKSIKNEPEIMSQPIHGNRLDAPGAHDVYAVIEQKTGELLRFGETGRGYLVRAREWINYFQKKGIDVVLKRLKTVSGKGAAKLLETRYIETYKKIFGKLPKYQKNFH
jgi:RHS repeat-associated protein